MDKNIRFRIWRCLLLVRLAAWVLLVMPIAAFAATTYDFSSLGASVGGFKPQGNRFLVSDSFINPSSGTTTTMYYGSAESTVTGMVIKADGTNLLSFDLNDMEFMDDFIPLTVSSMKITATRSVGGPVSVTVGPRDLPGDGSGFKLSEMGADLSVFTNVTQLQFDVTMSNKVLFLDFANITISNELHPTSDLAVVKTAPVTAVPQNSLVYIISLTNNGPNAAQNVILRDMLPANTTFKSVSMGGGSGWEISAPSVGAGGEITCSKASVTYGESNIFQIAVQVGAGTANESTINNTATVSAQTIDPVPGNNASTANSTVAYPVRGELPGISFYPTLSAACASVSSPNTIDAWGIEFAESLTFNQGKQLVLKGGFNSDFLVNSASTTVYSPLIVTNGQLTLENIVVK